MKPKIIIDGFNLGIVDDITLPIRNGFSFGAGIDIQKEPGILQVSQRLDAMTESAATNNITDGLSFMVRYSVKNKIYGMGNGGGGRIYDYDNTEAGKWCLVHDDANTSAGIPGMIEFNGNLHWTSNSALGKFDGTDWTDSYKTIDTGTDGHPMVIFGDYLVIGCGRYLNHLTSGGTLTQTAVDLPVGYKIRCLSVYGNRLYIGTWRGANIYEQPEATIFSCSMTQLLSGEFSEVTTLKECGVHAMTIWKNNLIIFAGISGNIYAFNGATTTLLKAVPKIEFNTGDWAQVFPGAVIEYGGNLIFGVSSTVADYAGIYMIDKNTLALTSSHILSTADTTNVLIYSMFQAATNAFYVSYYDASTTAYSVDAINITKRITTAAYWESQIYNTSSGKNLSDSSTEINGIELIAKPLATGNSITVKYKLDNAASWSTWGTITSANQSNPLWVAIGIAKTIQIQLGFTCNDTTNDSPSILEIRIY